jgi:DNA-binding Lrp family transcriptional regulator
MAVRCVCAPFRAPPREHVHHEARAYLPLVKFSEVDWRIVHELFRWDSKAFPVGPLRIPHEQIATALGVHRNTIQARLAAMRRQGVLEGTVFEPRPEPLRLVRAGYLFSGTRVSDAEALERDLAKFPWISAAALCLDHVFVHAWHPAGESLAVNGAAISEALGARKFEQAYDSRLFPSENPPVPRPTEVEARLMIALRKEPFRSMAAVAKATGLTERTAERRSAALVDRGAGSMIPLFRPARVEGWILVHLVARTAWENSAPGLASAFPDRIIGPFSPAHLPTVMVPFRSLAELQRRRLAAERLPGMGPIEPVLLQDVVYPNAFEGWLADRVGSVHPRLARV